MSSVNQRYLDLVLAYLSVLEEEKIELTKIKGLDAYRFSCPFCTRYVESQKALSNKTASLRNVGGDSWRFKCTRGYHSDCRGGDRSFHNFLLILNSDLGQRYRRDLALVTPDKPFPPEQMGRPPGGL